MGLDVGLRVAAATVMVMDRSSMARALTPPRSLAPPPPPKPLTPLAPLDPEEDPRIVEPGPSGYDRRSGGGVAGQRSQTGFLAQMIAQEIPYAGLTIDRSEEVTAAYEGVAGQYAAYELLGAGVDLLV